MIECLEHKGVEETKFKRKLTENVLGCVVKI